MPAIILECRNKESAQNTAEFAPKTTAATTKSQANSQAAQRHPSSKVTCCWWFLSALLRFWFISVPLEEPGLYWNTTVIKMDEPCLRVQEHQNMCLPTLQMSLPQLLALSTPDVKYYVDSIVHISNAFTRLFLREEEKVEVFVEGEQKAASDLLGIPTSA